MQYVSNYEEVVSLPKAQISTSGNFTTFSFCFQPSSSWDRVLFFPYSDSIPYPQGNLTHEWIVVDDISITEYNSNFAGPDRSVCNSNVIGPECPIPGATYAWSPPVGLSADDIPNPIATPSSPTTYTVSVTLPGLVSCSLTMTDQVYVDNAISSGTWVIPDSSRLTYFYDNGLVQGYTGPWPTVAPAHKVDSHTFFVEGTLFIDTVLWPFGFYFFNNTFLMAEGSKIVVKDGYTFWAGSNNVFTSCDNTYWDGVKVNGEAQLYQSEIKRALVGIEAQNYKEVSIEQTDFLDNKKSILLNGGLSNYSSLIKGCTFSSSTHPSSSGDYYPGISMEIDDNQGAISIESNSFNGNAGSITIEESDVDVNENTFDGFNNLYTFPGSPEKIEKAILLTGSSNNDKTATIENNYFLNVVEGITSNDDYELNIINNKFNKDDQLNYYSRIPGSYFLKIHDNEEDILVEDNEIYNSDVGIKITNSNSIEISDNFIDLEYQGNYSSYSSKTNNYSVGIFTGHYSLFHPTSNVLIDNNEVWHTKVGIQTEFLECTISNNEVFDVNDNMTVNDPCDPYAPPCPTSTPFGIRAMNELVTIQSNKVKNTSTYYSPVPENNLQIVGISLENTGTSPTSFSSVVECNNVENTGIGLKFSGNQGTGITIQFNKMKLHSRGLELANGGVIGDIGAPNAAADNRWEYTYSTIPQRLHTYANASYGGSSTIYVQSGYPYTPYIDPSYDMTPGFTAFIPDNGNTGTSPSCSTPNLSYNPADKKSSNLSQQKNGRQSNGHSIASGNRNANDSLKALDKQLLYYHLLQDTAELNKAEWRAFRDSMQSTPLHALLFGDTLPQIGNSVQDQRLREMATINRSFSGKKESTMAYKRDLANLASQCPYESGIAVYLARGILIELGENIMVNACEVSSNPPNTRRIARSMEEGEEYDLMLFPNPTKERLNIQWTVQEEENAYLQLFNALGKKVFDKSLEAGYLHTIDRQSLPSGIYILKVYRNNEEVSTRKVVFD